MPSMKGLLDKLPANLKRLVRKQTQPDWVAPMLATLTDEHFSDPKWIFEPKLDGVRCLIFRAPAPGRGKHKTARLMSRNQKNLNHSFPELHEAIERQQRPDFIADGEIVAFAPGSIPGHAPTPGKEISSFARLQTRLGIIDPQRARQRNVPVFLYLFDLLHVDGHDVTALPLLQRKQLLKRALKFRDPIRFTDHREEHGEKYLDEACKLGWEGLIAKRADSRYVHVRSRDWLKFKCVNQQEFVIAGYTDPQRSRIGFGALLVGYYDQQGDLHYAGKVGTGFSDRSLRALHERLAKLQRDRPPFAEGDPGIKGAHWVSPRLVGQIAFTEWTRDGRLRHPRFLGLRTDKPPKQVVREQPAHPRS
jgi:bifunctional non-homologous end joining protein LigD